MNSDIRVSVNFVQHPKTKKTIRKYGHAAVVSLIALWGFAAQRRPEGNLTGMDVDDIAIAACWDGDEQEFFDMCVSMKWIDVYENGEIHLHGWREAQGYVVNSVARSERSRRAAQARWEKSANKEIEQISGFNAERNASSMLDACDEHCSMMQNAMPFDENGNAPSPIPSPVPIPSHYGENTPLTPQQGYKPETVTLFTLCDSSASPSGCDFSHAEDKSTNGGKKKGFSDDFNRFWEKYPRKVSKGQAWKTWQKLQKDGTLPDVDTLIEAVRWRQLEPDWEKDGGKYIPHASTWLNACGWEDEGCKAPEQIPNDPREERAVEICKNHGIDYYFCACPCTQEAAVDKYKRLIAATRELRSEGLELYEPFRENFRGHLRRYGVLEQVEEELGWTEGA